MGSSLWVLFVPARETSATDPPHKWNGGRKNQTINYSEPVCAARNLSFPGLNQSEFLRLARNGKMTQFFGNMWDLRHRKGKFHQMTHHP